jgi:hypothetical protein
MQHLEGQIVVDLMTGKLTKIIEVYPNGLLVTDGGIRTHSQLDWDIKNQGTVPLSYWSLYVTKY